MIIIWLIIFQSTLPRRERLCFLCSKLGVMIFQSTLPRRERPIRRLFMIIKYKFQSTLPRRERQKTTGVYFKNGKISIHAPAKGATRGARQLLNGTPYFNPRSREGSDLWISSTSRSSRTFQSTLPRRERRCKQYARGSRLPISIHAPAKGATIKARWNEGYTLISIHAPAKGATSCRVNQNAQLRISIHAPAKGATRD